MPLIRDRHAAIEQRSGSQRLNGEVVGVVEQRNMASSPVAGYSADPSVGMPWGTSREHAAVPVTTQSVQSLPVVQAALRVLKSAVIGRGALRAYTTEVTDSGVPFNPDPPVNGDGVAVRG